MNDESKALRAHPAVMAAMLLLCGCCGLLAQAPACSEMARWQFDRGGVVCGTCDAAGSIVAYGVGDAAAGWQLVLYDPRQRVEVSCIDLPRRPVMVRFADVAHVEVRWPESDGFFALSHWHRLRRSDGVEQGEPVLYRVTDDDPVARARFRGKEPMGAEPGLRCDASGTLWFVHGDAKHAINDTLVLDLAWTPDGRFVLCWLPSGVAVVAAADGAVRRLPYASESVRAVIGGGDGDELVIVTGSAVQVVRASTAGVIRSIPYEGGQVVAAALQPGGSWLALARANVADVQLLDLASSRLQRIATRARAIAWNADGSRLACLHTSLCSSFGIDGTLLRERSIHAPSAFKGGPLSEQVWSSPFAYRQSSSPGNLLVLANGTEVWCHGGGTVSAYEKGARRTAATHPYRLWASLGPDEWIATEGSRLLRCDSDFESQQLLHLAEPIDLCAATARNRRVAVAVGREVIVYTITR